MGGRYRWQLLLNSTEVDAFQRLKRQLGAYQVVFGHARQEELMTLLDHSESDTTELAEWVIDPQPSASELSVVEAGRQY